MNILQSTKTQKQKIIFPKYQSWSFLPQKKIKKNTQNIKYLSGNVNFEKKEIHAKSFMKNPLKTANILCIMLQV